MFLAVGVLGRQQGVHGGNGGLQNAAHAQNVAVDPLDVLHGLAVFLHLRQAEDHLKVVHEVVALAAQRGVQILQLAIGLLQHVRLFGDLFRVFRVADVQRRAPADDGQTNAQQRQLRAAGEKGDSVEQDIEKDAEHRADLHGVDGDGEARGFLDVHSAS